MDLILNTLKSVAYIFVNPSFILLLIALGIVFYMKNKKIAFMQKMVVGENINSPLELTLSQITLGIIIGCIASIIIGLLGITFKEGSGIEIIFSLSIISMFFKSKIGEFSYLSSIFGILSIVFTYLKIGGDESNLFRVDITSLMALVAVVYIAKGFLMIVDGYRGAIAAFSKRGDKLIGGYILNRSWALPIAVFIAILASQDPASVTEAVNTPTWWPLISTSNILNLISTSILTMIPFFGVTSYNAATFTNTKRGKSLSSGIYNIVYGIIVFLVSLIAVFGLAGEILVLIIVPLLYELIFRYERKVEEKKEPIFYSDEEGICVLEVVPFSKAHSSGIKIGDRIVSLNGNKVLNEKQIYESITNNYIDSELELRSIDGNIKKVTLGRCEKPGMLLVPKAVDESKKIDLTKEKILEMIKKLKDR